MSDYILYVDKDYEAFVLDSDREVTTKITLDVEFGLWCADEEKDNLVANAWADGNLRVDLYIYDIEDIISVMFPTTPVPMKIDLTQEQFEFIESVIKADCL